MHWICSLLVAVTLRIHVIFPPRSQFPRWNTVLNKITNIDSTVLNQTDTTVIKTLLFGSLKYSNQVNLRILNATIEYIIISKRFD